MFLILLLTTTKPRKLYDKRLAAVFKMKNTGISSIKTAISIISKLQYQQYQKNGTHDTIFSQKQR
jgi:hypothetical protein